MEWRGTRPKEKGRRRGAGRLGGGKNLRVFLWLVRFLDKKTDRQTGASLRVASLPSTSGKISFVGDSAEDQGMERQSDRTRAASAPDSSPPLISYAQDKLLTQSLTACWAGTCGYGRRNPSLRPSTCLSTSLALPRPPPVFAITIKRQHPGPRSTDWRLGLTEMCGGLGMLCVCVCVHARLSVHVHTASLCMCSMFRCQKLMRECLCLFLSISWFFCLYPCVCSVGVCV